MIPWSQVVFDLIQAELDSQESSPEILSHHHFALVMHKLEIDKISQITELDRWCLIGDSSSSEGMI